MKKTLGERVEEGEPIALLYTQKKDLGRCMNYLDSALIIGEKRPAPPLVYEIIE